MKKYMTVALAALVAVAVAAVAVAQDPNAHTMTADVVISKKKGTKKRSKSATAKVSLTTNENIDPTVDVFTYHFPRQLSVSTKGFPTCTQQKMVDAGGDDVCPKKSKIGFGTATARVGSRNDPNQLLFDIQIYANKQGATMWLENTAGITRAIDIQLEDGTGGFNQDLVADIPPDVEYVGPVPVVLERVDVQLGAYRKKVIRRNGKKRVKHFAVISKTTCPDSGVELGTTLTYKVPAGQAPTSARDNASC